MRVLTCFCNWTRNQGRGEILGVNVTREFHGSLAIATVPMKDPKHFGAKDWRNTMVSWELKAEVNISKMCKEVNFENLLLICYIFRVSILIILKIPCNKHTFWMTTASSFGSQLLKPWHSEKDLRVYLNVASIELLFRLGGSPGIWIQFLALMLIRSLDLE